MSKIRVLIKFYFTFHFSIQQYKEKLTNILQHDERKGEHDKYIGMISHIKVTTMESCDAK